MSGDDPIELYEQLLMRFDLEELRTLCFKLGVEYDDLAGEGRAGKARELIRLLQRQGWLDRLAQHLARLDRLAQHSPLPPRDHDSIESHYITSLRQLYGNVPLGGIAPRVQDYLLRIPLDQLFVAPQAEAHASPSLQSQSMKSALRGYQTARTGNVALIGLNEIVAAPHAVILGAPGAGKTTLLRWLIAETLKSFDVPEEAERSQRRLPLYIRLAHFATALQQQPWLTLDQFLRQTNSLVYESLVEPSLSDGHVWLLLDGLDEVAERQARVLVRNAIEALQAQFPNIDRIIVTSRIVGYRTAPLSDTFRHFTLQPFGLPEITRFIHNWYRAVYRLTQTSPDFAEAERRANRLLEGLEDKPRVLQLAGTPLFLAMIALMDWKGKEIPKRRVELYETATRTLLEDWPAEQGRPTQIELTMGEMLRILAQLALDLFKTSPDATIRQEALESRVAELIRVVRGSTLSEAISQTRRWLPLLSEHSGLLLDAGVDRFQHSIYTFLHLSFVEYLCGRALADLWHMGNLNLADYAPDPRWHEVLLLMAGHIGMDYSTTESTRLVEEVCAIPFPHQDILHQPIVLASACLADDVQVSVNLRNRILDELVALWNHSPPSRLRSRLFRLLVAMRGTESATEVIQRILPLLSSGHNPTRSSVVELLGYLGNPTDKALKAHLLSALNDPSIDVQRAAVRALDVLGLAAVSDVYAALLQALRHPSAGVRTRAILALAPLTARDQDIVGALLHLLEQDTSDEPRRMAARILGSVGSSRVDLQACKLEYSIVSPK